MVNVLAWLSALACLWLMANLPRDTWLRFFIWMALGVVLYVVYGRRNSRFTTPGTGRTPPPRTPRNGLTAAHPAG